MLNNGGSCRSNLHSTQKLTCVAAVVAVDGCFSLFSWASLPHWCSWEWKSAQQQHWHVNKQTPELNKTSSDCQDRLTLRWTHEPLWRKAQMTDTYRITSAEWNRLMLTECLMTVITVKVMCLISESDSCRREIHSDVLYAFLDVTLISWPSLMILCVSVSVCSAVYTVWQLHVWTGSSSVQ